MEVPVNVRAFEELKRVLQAVPESEFSLWDWDRCACGHATCDSWFQQQGFTTCSDFAKAAAFFAIPRTKLKNCSRHHTARRSPRPWSSGTLIGSLQLKCRTPALTLSSTLAGKPSLMGCW